VQVALVMVKRVISIFAVIGMLEVIEILFNVKETAEYHILVKGIGTFKYVHELVDSWV
jgi:hypothetical protein